MSIRITSNGHNFSHNTATAKSCEEVQIVIESIKAMLLPTPLLNDCTPAEHLMSAGIAIQEDMEIIITVKQDKITTALIVLPRLLLSEIHRVYGENVLITTPLLATPLARNHEVQLHLSADKTLLCINLFNGGERLFAEMFNVKTDADILYWLSRIGEGYDLNSDYTIYIDGENKDLLKLLKKYYKRVELCV